MPTRDRRLDWTPDDVESLRALRATGLSMAEIGVELGRSPQAVRFKSHQLQLPRPKRIRRGDPLDRFWAKVDRRGDGECWLWLGCERDEKGYGCFWDGDRNVPAHRFAYELLIGTVGDGFELLHLCDNRACVNPSHLTPGTHLSNMRDMVEKGRQTRRLSDADVAEIRARAARGESSTTLASSFGVTRAAILRRLRQ